MRLQNDGAGLGFTLRPWCLSCILKRQEEWEGSLTLFTVNGCSVWVGVYWTSFVHHYLHFCNGFKGDFKAIALKKWRK